MNYTKHLIYSHLDIKSSLKQLNDLGKDAILFVVDENNKLVGSLTDGDIRRGLLNNISIFDKVTNVIQPNPRFIRKGESNINKLIEYREGNFRILPILDNDDKVVNIINFRETRSYLPIDAIIMAGGRGQRLMPLTELTPKPLLKIAGKPIMEYNLDRLSLYGISDFWFSINYLGEQIRHYFKDGLEKNVNIRYIEENEPLGTIGAISKVENFEHDSILVTNSDILTNLDYEHFFLEFINSDADLAVVSIPYEVNVPYAVLETRKSLITSFKEKPTYTYYSNGGIYLMKKKMLDYIPKSTFFNATDLMERLINEGFKVVSYPLIGYWLDIGKHEDFQKAQNDITKIKF